jgi:hypothetical protein
LQDLYQGCFEEGHNTPNGKGCGGGHNDEFPNVGEEVEMKDARGSA